MKLAIQTIGLVTLASTFSLVAACGDDGGGSSSGSGGETSSSSATTTTTGSSGSTASVSSGNGSSSSGGDGDGDGGDGQGGGGDGGSGQGGGDGGAGQGGAGQGGGGTGGGGSVDIEGACSTFCTSLVDFECVSDVDACTDGCIEESDIEACGEELVAFYECYAANIDDCNAVPGVCTDEGEALEACLPDDA